MRSEDCHFQDSEEPLKKMLFNFQGGILIDLAFTNQGGWLAPVGTFGTLWYYQLGLVLTRWYLQLIMEESITCMTPDSNDVLAWR